MANRKKTRRKPSRFRRFGRRVARRAAKQKFPLETVIAGAAIPFTPASDGWNSPFGLAQQGGYDQIMPTLAKGFLNMEPNGQVNIWGIINPFDFNSARYTKMLIASALVSKVRKKFVHLPLDRIPMVGKYIS